MTADFMLFISVLYPISRKSRIFRVVEEKPAEKTHLRSFSEIFADANES